LKRINHDYALPKTAAASSRRCRIDIDYIRQRWKIVFDEKGDFCRCARFQLSGAADLGCLFERGNDRGSASLSDSPYGQFSTVAGVTVATGLQKLTWRLGGPGGMPHNGDTVVAGNAIHVSVEDLPKYTEALGVHIYPDYTAELVFSDEMPHQSPRGLTYAKKYHVDGK
jgi:hypothetical protein